GNYTESGTVKTLAETWNGTSWSIATTPNPASATSSQLNSVACTSASLCSAVGNYTKSGTVKPLAATWNGTSSSIPTTSNLFGEKDTVLLDISCLSSTLCIAVGYTVNSKSEKQVMAERFFNTLWGPVTDASEGFLKTYPTSEFTSIACVTYEVTNECR